MVKVHSVEMIEHSALSTPDVTAHAALPNGALVGLTYTNSSKVTKAPATGSDLYIVLNEQVGDDSYVANYTIPAGDYVNVFALKNWVGKELDVTLDNIVSMSGVEAGNDFTFDATTFKFKKGASTSGNIGFKVMKLTTFGVRVLIYVA